MSLILHWVEHLSTSWLTLKLCNQLTAFIKASRRIRSILGLGHSINRVLRLLNKYAIIPQCTN